MGSFSVQLYNRDFSSILTPYTMVFDAQRLSWNAVGGCEEAVISVSGPEIELWELVERLRSPIEVVAPDSKVVWWGYVESVEIQSEALAISVSLEKMSNRVCVTYSEVNVAGTIGERKTTTWYEDADSIATYGTKERRYSKSQATANEADNYAQTQLARVRFPITKHSFQDGVKSATLTCTGWWKTLDWKYYENSNGKEGYEEVGQGLQALGKGLTKTTISFEAGTTKKIKDTGEDLLGFSANEWVYVSGSVANNSAFEISSVHDVDAPGGSYLIVEQAVVNGAAGPSVTVQGAQKAAQSFQISTAAAWLAATIRIRIKKEGSPADNVLISLRADSGGPTGSVLATGSLPGSALSENLNWVSFELSSRVLLQPATTYWIVVERSGAQDMANFYKVDTNEDLGYTSGELRISGSGWSSRMPDADMLFQVGGVEESTSQLENLISTGGQFFGEIEIDIESGVYSSPYRDGDQSALSCAEELMDSGTTNLRRLLSRVDNQRRVEIFEEPISGSQDYYLHASGVLHDWLDRKLNKWDYPVGVWARLADVIPASADTSKIADPSKVFIEQVIYTLETDSIVLQERDYSSLMEIQ